MRYRITLPDFTPNAPVLAEFSQKGNPYKVVTSNLESLRSCGALPVGTWIDIELIGQGYSVAGKVYR